MTYMTEIGQNDHGLKSVGSFNLLLSTLESVLINFGFIFRVLNHVLGAAEDALGRKSWSNQEIELVLKQLHSFVVSDQLPGKTVCTELIKNNSILSHRKWQNIKDFIRNYKIKAKRATEMSK